MERCVASERAGECRVNMGLSERTGKLCVARPEGPPAGTPLAEKANMDTRPARPAAIPHARTARRPPICRSVGGRPGRSSEQKI